MNRKLASSMGLHLLTLFPRMPAQRTFATRRGADSELEMGAGKVVKLATGGIQYWGAFVVEVRFSQG